MSVPHDLWERTLSGKKWNTGASINSERREFLGSDPLKVAARIPTTWCVSTVYREGFPEQASPRPTLCGTGRRSRFTSNQHRFRVPSKTSHVALSCPLPSGDGYQPFLLRAAATAANSSDDVEQKMCSVI